VQASKQLEKQEFHKLPKRILAMSSRPILYSYKYAKHPFRLDIAIDKHERLEGISTVIESANATVLFLEEGKVLYKIIYTIRNSFKQFMQLEFPADAGIWTVLVDNKREKASRSKKGKVLIPLVRSPGNGEQLKSFKVELIYTLPLKKFGISGSSQCSLPISDIFINKMRIVMFMPDGFSYKFDKGEWKEEKTALIKKIRKDISKPLPLKEEEEKPQETTDEKEDGYELDAVDARIKDKSGKKVKADVPAPAVTGKIISKKKIPHARVVTGPAGLDSIKVHLPLSGIKYLFSKKIIDKDEKYPLKFSYFSKNLQKVILYLIIVTAFTVFLIILVRKRKRRKK
jgi:hypothetical protein